MESIIETLYINLNRPQAPDDPELEKIKQEFFSMNDLIARQYGLDFADRFTALHRRIVARGEKKEFSKGFHACARLMLEALGGQPSI